VGIALVVGTPLYYIFGGAQGESDEHLVDEPWSGVEESPPPSEIEADDAEADTTYQYECPICGNDFATRTAYGIHYFH
jgi:hypothetical protein